MPVRVVETLDTSVLNFCAKHLARENGVSAEAWRFPIIEQSAGELPGAIGPNVVTFVFDARRGDVNEIGVVGTFSNLYEALPLRSLMWNGADSGYRALTVLVPIREVHQYKFIVDGRGVVDPINPQRVSLDDGSVWSRFFTDFCSQPLCFERWEYALLLRLCAHILPFRTQEGENFLQRYYYSVDRASRERDLPHAYRLDDQVGVVNYIDNLVAREEGHRLIDYKICLSLIDRVLRMRNPYLEPAEMARDMYAELYDQMGRDEVPGWDRARYNSPRFFLQLLRRHTVMGAFSHPKYGGNAAGAAWAFLSERYLDAQGRTLFDWRQALESPLGTSTSYRG